MCKKSINAVARLYEQVESTDDFLTLKNQFDSIEARRNSNNEIFLENFSIVTNVDLINEHKSEDEHDCNNSAGIDFQIKLTKQDDKTSWIVDNFYIPPKPIKAKTAREIRNVMMVSNISKILLNDNYAGQYMIEVNSKEKDSEDEWETQGLTELLVR